MTVCLAALCEGGKSVVLAADRQITMPGFNFEYEHTEKKIDSLAGSHVMIIGDRLFGAELVRRAGAALGDGAHGVQEVAEALTTVFMDAHLRRAEHVILHPRGFKLSEFKERALMIPVATYQEIDKLLFNFGMGAVEFLIGGVDSSGGHIFRVHYDGVAGGDWLEWCDGTAFYASGGGASPATVSLALVGQNRDCSLSRTLYNVYAAKRDAEAAPGVGPTTDMLVVSSSGAKTVEASTLKSLGSLWETKRQARRVTDIELQPIKIS